jgi:hypothetical protein
VIAPIAMIIVCSRSEWSLHRAECEPTIGGRIRTGQIEHDASSVARNTVNTGRRKASALAGGDRASLGAGVDHPQRPQHWLKRASGPACHVSEVRSRAADSSELVHDVAAVLAHCHGARTIRRAQG